MPSRPLDAIALALLVLLSLSWGLGQTAMKLALPAFPPLMQMGLRSAGACLLVVAWCAVTGRGDLLRRDGTLWWGLLAGALFGIEFVLIYVGLQWTEASRSIVFVYTAPFFVALGAHWLLPQERLVMRQWLGLALCFAGVAVALGVPRLSASPLALLGDMIILLGGALWGATTLVVKASPLHRASPEKVLVYQLAVSAAMGGVGALALGERVGADALGVPLGALLYQMVWVAGITYVLWFRMLSVYPASPLQTGTSMTPLFGVLGAHLILGEPVSLLFALAAVLVALGLALVSQRRRARSAAPV